MDGYVQLVDALLRADVRFVLIGVGGVNYYMLPRQPAFVTEDRDLLLPLDPANTLRCWQTAESLGFALWTFSEPLGAPLDLWLAERVVERQAVITGHKEPDLKIDFTYTMSGFKFEEVWTARRSFKAEGVEVPVASLEQIVESKRRAGREKDLLFFATHRETLTKLLEDDS